MQNTCIGCNNIAHTTSNYLTGAVYSPASDPVKAVMAGRVSGFQRPMTQRSSARFTSVAILGIRTPSQISVD